jgi:tubulin-folding cofactor B
MGSLHPRRDDADIDDPEELSRSIQSKLSVRHNVRSSSAAGSRGDIGGQHEPMITCKDTIDAIKAYVTAPASQNEAESSVRLLVTSSALKSSFMEILFNKHMTVGAVKDKLQTHVGTSRSSMVLVLKDQTGGAIGELTDDERKLGYYSPASGYVLHVVDSDKMSLANTGWLEDVSKVEKYVMSDAEYDAREDTYRKFKEQRLKEDPGWTLQKEIQKNKAAAVAARGDSGGGFGDVSFGGSRAPGGTEDDEVLASHVEVGKRCEVSTSQGSKRGIVRVVGENLEGLPKGFWVGVEYDEPVGKNDGMVGGIRYFDCPMGYGGFVRPGLVSVGDEFVPFDEDVDFSDEDEI